ncbi:hypothetical protein [Sphingomicrobium arenosum]|uniref:hypothetical protein n=1 Tax=Sphingomicrobium arenosum TaxID=2233861 RepID=UPI00223F3535|nr:hypothetical protein [Sphingomicrobium arenosum]
MTRPKRELGEGERRERAKRRAFWGYNVAAGIVMFIGAAAFTFAFRDEALDPTVRTALLVGSNIFICVALLAIGIAFWRGVDELERADNLWAAGAAFFGLMFASLIFMSLAGADLIEATLPNFYDAQAIGAAIGATLAYFGRKIARRF